MAVMVRYFATQNVRSPYVAVIGDWPDRAALVRGTLRSAVRLGQRPALPCEIELLEGSTRHVFLAWDTLRIMLWSHRSPDLEGYYPALVQSLRDRWGEVRHMARERGKKIRAQERERVREREIVEQNRRRLAVLLEQGAGGG